MDRKEFKETVEKALNQGFEAAKKSAAFVSKKVGEASRMTKLLARKLTLEHKIGKKFAELGHRVYDLTVREKTEIAGSDTEMSRLIEELKKMDEDLTGVESKLEEERKQMKKKD